MKPYLKPIAFLPLVILASGCASNDKEIPHAIGRGVMRVPGDANMYTVDDKDMQMDHAVRHARQTVSQFITALRNPPPSSRDFQVKKLFVAKDGTAEHIWLADVKFNGNRFVGIVDNHPNKLAGLKIGDRESVNPDEITDWSYVENGQLVGGYTVRVLYTEMSNDEKQQFAKQADFKIAE